MAGLEITVESGSFKITRDSDGYQYGTYGSDFTTLNLAARIIEVNGSATELNKISLKQLDASTVFDLTESKRAYNNAFASTVAQA